VLRQAHQNIGENSYIGRQSVSKYRTDNFYHCSGNFNDYKSRR